MQIRENTDFPRQKPLHMPNAEANFEDWIVYGINALFKKVSSL